MSYKLPELPKISTNKSKKTPKKAPPKPPVAKAKSSNNEPIKNDAVAQPPQTETNNEEPNDGNRPKRCHSAAEKAIYLKQQVVPIVMEGMLGLAREQPKDPIQYLEKFWLKEMHKCSVPLPKELL